MFGVRGVLLSPADTLTHITHIWLQRSVQKAVLSLAPTLAPAALTQPSPPLSASAPPSPETTRAEVCRQTSSLQSCTLFVHHNTHIHGLLKHQRDLSPSCLACWGPGPHLFILQRLPGWSGLKFCRFSHQLITAQKEKVLPQFAYI